MLFPTLQRIEQSQLEYHQLVIHLRNQFEIENLTWKQATQFIDEIKYFWLERLDIISWELETLTEYHTCFLLSGAIYLNVSDNEHFYFKSFGDYHLLPDPFLKMEYFFRMPEEALVTVEIKAYFERVLADTIEILENYRNAFFILPIEELAIEDNADHRDLLDKFFMGFLSSAFGKQYRNQDEFCTEYKTFEDIENQLDPYVNNKLTFSNHIDRSISLRKKIEIYNEVQSGYFQLVAGESEARVFLIALYSYLSQIADILLICTNLQVNPYIGLKLPSITYFSLCIHS